MSEVPPALKNANTPLDFRSTRHGIGRPNARSPYFIAFLFGVATLGIQLLLLLRYPNIVGVDTYIRLVNHGYIFVRHWLPALQLLIHIVSAITHGSAALLSLLAIISALAVASFYLWCSRILTRWQALAAGLTLMLYAPFLEISRMPYEESLVFLFLCLTFYFLESKKMVVAIVFYFLACATRQEAWFLLPAVYWLAASRLETKKVKVGLWLFACVAFSVIMNAFPTFRAPFDPLPTILAWSNLFGHSVPYLLATISNQATSFFLSNMFLVLAGFTGLVLVSRDDARRPYALLVLILLAVALGNGVTLGTFFSRPFLLTQLFLIPPIYFGLDELWKTDGIAEISRRSLSVLVLLSMILGFLVSMSPNGSVAIADASVSPYVGFGKTLSGEIGPGDRCLVLYQRSGKDKFGAGALFMRSVYYSGYEIYTTFLPFADVPTAQDLAGLISDNDARFVLIDFANTEAQDSMVLLAQRDGLLLVASNDTIGERLYRVR